MRSIDLISHVQDMCEDAEEGTMTYLDTIFEPSLDEISDQMEASLMRPVSYRQLDGYKQQAE